MKNKTKVMSIRIEVDLLEKVEKEALKNDRSINYTIIKCIENNFTKDTNNAKINTSTLKEIKTYCKKLNMSVSELIEQMWKAFSKTYKR
jgi:hypothetical protein